MGPFDASDIETERLERPGQVNVEAIDTMAGHPRRVGRRDGRSTRVDAARDDPRRRIRATVILAVSVSGPTVSKTATPDPSR
ncbi:MAG: hypothetical protein AAF982_05965 [Pseudomonadota bacterium]